MKTITTLATSIIAAMLLFTGCTKDGATGPQGVAGTNGMNGTNGNANVSGYTFSVDLSGFTGPLSPNNNYQYVLNPTTIMGGSTFIGANDAVLMYLFDKTVSSTDYYTAMPCDNYFNTGTAFNSFSFDIGATGSANIILLNIRNSAGGQPYTTMSGPLNLKMVYIQASHRSIKPTLPKDLSYASVKAYYHLKD